MLWDWRLNTTAIFIGWCAACSSATAVPWDLATRGGDVLHREGAVGGLTLPHAAAFRTPTLGWVTGARISYHNHRAYQRIVSTSDGGRTWRTDYTTIP